MPLVLVGVILLACKMAAFGPVATWSWWIIAAPFVGAVLWWQFADSSGWTKRRAMDKMEQRKAARRERAVVALGGDKRRDKRAAAASQAAAKRQASVSGSSKSSSARHDDRDAETSVRGDLK
jgi:small Trp-rich protein